MAPRGLTLSEGAPDTVGTMQMIEISRRQERRSALTLVLT